MKANAIPILSLFEKKMRLEVPLFQRQYVWSLEEQWEPLWEDISRKFTEYLEGRQDAPSHFLGAMVLDQRQTPSHHVEKRQIIDGQQRLTTIQIFLAALRDFCDAQECEDVAKEYRSFTLNTGMMANSEVDQFKVWPTQLDRKQYSDVLTLASRDAIEKEHPRTRRKYARKYEPRPKMVEAYLFFADQITDYFLGSDEEPPLAVECPLPQRLEETFRALKNALQVAVIDLEPGDDAQVIFETLNARGEPLLPADLLRNYVFLRASRNDEPQEELYDQHWRHFDDEFWREEVRQGRLTRPRSDHFIQHFLASRLVRDIAIKHLYVEYKWWIDRHEPFDSVAEEVATLARYSKHYRQLVAPKLGEATYRLAAFLNTFDVGTAFPVLLYLKDHNLSDDDWAEVSNMLESYVVRRVVAGWTNKNYNRVFLSLLRTLKKDGATPDTLRRALSQLSGPSAGWPEDGEFSEAWMNGNAYERLRTARLTHVFTRLSEALRTNRNEMISVDAPLTVEHIMPQSWRENWPLSDGNKGMTQDELWDAPGDDSRAVETKKRQKLVGTMGNLTVLTQPLNASVSNDAWLQKKPAILESSLMPVNQHLHDAEVWDHDAIVARGEFLLDKALEIWPPARKFINKQEAASPE